MKYRLLSNCSQMCFRIFHMCHFKNASQITHGRTAGLLHSSGSSCPRQWQRAWSNSTEPSKALHQLFCLPAHGYSGSTSIPPSLQVLGRLGQQSLISTWRRAQGLGPIPVTAGSHPESTSTMFGTRQLEVNRLKPFGFLSKMLHLQNVCQYDS